MKSKAFAISVLVNIGLAVWLAAIYAGKRPESATADPPGDHGKPTTQRNADPGNRPDTAKAPLPGPSETDPRSVFRSLNENYNPENIALAKQTLAKLSRESPNELMRLMHWLPNDSIAASEWLSQLPANSPQRKFATRQIVSCLRRVGDKQGADQWERSLTP